MHGKKKIKKATMLFEKKTSLSLQDFNKPSLCIQGAKPSFVWFLFQVMLSAKGSAKRNLL